MHVAMQPIVEKVIFDIFPFQSVLNGFFKQSANNMVKVSHL
jgi:hypothetical protein